MGATHIALPMARMLTFKPGTLRPAIRLGVWAAACFRFLAGNAVDKVAGRDTVERRAARLRRMFEATGASFVKVGQQLSMRADLLPYAYCVELSRMLDHPCLQPRPFLHAGQHDLRGLIEQRSHGLVAT